MRHPADTYAEIHKQICGSLKSCDRDADSRARTADSILRTVMNEMLADLWAVQRECDTDQIGQLVNHCTLVRELTHAINEDDNLPF